MGETTAVGVMAVTVMVSEARAPGPETTVTTPTGTITTKETITAATSTKTEITTVDVQHVTNSTEEMPKETLTGETDIKTTAEEMTDPPREEIPRPEERSLQDENPPSHQAPDGPGVSVTQL